MANLPSGDIDAVHADIMRRYSSIFREIPVSKAQLRSFLVIVDGELEAAEIAIVRAITNPAFGLRPDFSKPRRRSAAKMAYSTRCAALST